MLRAIVLLAVLAAPKLAEGSCASPIWNGPPSGLVPVRGTVYLYDQARRWEDEDFALHWSHKTGHASWRLVGDHAIRIDYAGMPGAALVVRAGAAELARYTLDVHWHAPRLPPRIVNIKHYEHEWTCSYADVVVLEFDELIAAVRVRWTFDGDTREHIIPADNGKVELGKIDCGSANIDPRELHHGGMIELFAIRADGSELRVPLGPQFSTATGLFDGMWSWHGLLGIPAAGVRFVLAGHSVNTTWRQRAIALALGAGFVLMLRGRRASGCSRASRQPRRA